MKDYKSKKKQQHFKRKQIIERKLRDELEKHGEVKSKRVRQEKNGRKDNIGMDYLATEKQAKLATEMINKTNQQVAM